MNLAWMQAALLAATAVLAGCTQVGTGDKAPDFDLTDSDGQTVDLDTFAGKPVVLFFALTRDCLPCERETKNVLVPLHHDVSEGAGFLTISLAPYETNEDLRAFKSDTGAAWAHARDTDRVAQRYDVRQTSTIVVLDADHVIAFRGVDPSRGTIEDNLGV